LAKTARVIVHFEGSGGETRRYGVDARKFRALVAAVVAVALLLAGGSAVGTWFLYGAIGNGPSARAENALLRVRLQGLEARLARVDQSLDRVMAHDAKIRELTREDSGAHALGIGPLNDLELAAAEREGREPVLPGEDFELGDALVDAELIARLGDAEQRADALGAEVGAEEESLQEVRGYLDDRSSLMRAAPSVWPVRGWLTSHFGWRSDPANTSRRVHTGLDISAPRGTPVIASGDGFVVFAGYHSAYGNLVVIDHGYGITTKYAHLSRIQTQSGHRVQRGDIVGRVGNTGRSTGPHLHFEVIQDGVPVNPGRFLAD
jgi:murein DD-endopeptidase MepM/ murein hydrolase activator NlpD